MEKLNEELNERINSRVKTNGKELKKSKGRWKKKERGNPNQYVRAYLY